MKSLRNPEYLESIRQNLLSGEWLLLFGDSLCVLSVVERLKTVTHVLAVGLSKIVMLAKKTANFRELFGMSEEMAKQVVAMSMNESGYFCTVFTFFSENEDTKRRVIDELIERLRKLGKDEDKEDEKPSTTTI